MRIAAVGLSGLVGSRVLELLGNEHEFVQTGLSAGVDITKRDTIFDAIKKFNPDIVLNLAAKADVDGSEIDKSLGVDGEAWKLNVLGAQNVALACKEFGKKLIHVSTDFVFDGKEEFYNEDGLPNPVDWYGMTKYKGEEAVKGSGCNFIIARIAYPYRAEFEKKDFVRAMLSRLKEGLSIKGVTDHIMTPTFVDDIALALNSLFIKDDRGIYHVVGSSSVSPYDAAMLIAEKFGLNQALISKTTREEYFAGKAQRPFRLFLKNDKIQKLGVEMKTFSQGIDELKNQLES